MDLKVSEPTNNRMVQVVRDLNPLNILSEVRFLLIHIIKIFFEGTYNKNLVEKFVNILYSKRKKEENQDRRLVKTSKSIFKF